MQLVPMLKNFFEKAEQTYLFREKKLSISGEPQVLGNHAIS
jgi:hypothetical protein